MSGKKKLLIVLVVLLTIAVAGLIWMLASYHVVGFRLYPKNAAVLDLRGQEISIKNYEKLAEKMPDAEIHWDVPFQGGLVANDTTEITVTGLTEEDVLMLDHLTQLKTVNAEECTDYAQLQALRERRPEVQVDYKVRFNAESFRWDEKTVVLSATTEEDAQLLRYFPKLETVAISAENPIHTEASVAALKKAALEMDVKFGICAGGTIHLEGEETVTLENVTSDELELLPYLSSLKKLHIVNPVAEPESILALQEKLPNAEVSWEVEIAGQTFDNTVTEVDLSNVVVEDLSEVESQAAYLPNLETLVLGVCGIDDPDWGNSKSKLAASAIENEDLSAYRDRVREDYKVVWTVRLGPHIALRTDKDNFMPNHFGVGQLPDSYAYNLRYCEDMVCLDVGHMTLTDISFVEFMPKLKYLILAWTEVQYIEPIRSCKNLVFLELDNSCIRDLSPLVDCTALEDLNLGNTFCDVTPILEMTWLKNVYFILGSPGSAWKVSQAIPTAHVVATGDATVGGGWRRLPNYYDMRDCLGMYYMN